MAASEQDPALRATDSFPAQVDALAWAFESSPDLAFAAGRDGRIVFANPAARARWPGLARGVPAASLFPDDARDGYRTRESAVLATGEAARLEWGDHGPAGARAWFACTLSPLRDRDATIAGVLCVSSNVTQLKRSEARLRRSEELMVDTQGIAHLGTWEWDVSEPNATWSSELYRIYGLTPETYTPSYENYLKMVHPDDRQRVMDATNRVFHEHVRYSHDERIFRPDGSMRYLHTWAHPVLDDGGRLIRLVGVCQDTTDQKLAEEQVQKLNADLERRVAERTRTIENSLRDLEAFNAMASHDLRAPLWVIQGNCALILQHMPDPMPARIGDSLARIQRSVTHMTALVTDLLTLAQVGHAPLARVDVDLSALCNDVIAQLRRGSPNRVVSVDVQPGLRCFGDAGLMRAALENLLGNAWKYSSRVESARIEVGATDVDGRPAFFIRDNGAGFDMKDAHRLFAPFERLHKASEFEGTGIGLAGVHRIIERHGGRIWAEGEPGRGATFSFELPAA
jgi:PAS domain S-box-containing protein